MKRNRILLTVCTVILLASICFCAVGVSYAQNAARDQKAQAVLDSSDEKLLAALSVIYAKSGNLMTGMPYATVTLTQTALMKTYAGDTDALSYLNSNVNEYLQNAFDMMDRIIAEYDLVIDKYKGSSYKDKRDELKEMLDKVRSSSKELVARTRTLISGTDSNYGSYYTAYVEQLQTLTSRLESYSGKIDNEYDAIMEKLLGSDFDFIK